MAFASSGDSPLLALEPGIRVLNRLHRDPSTGRLTSSIGTKENVLISSGILDLEEKTTIIACTDGLTDMVDFNSIEKTCASFHGELKALGSELVRRAYENGGKDNVSMIVARCSMIKIY